MARLLFGGLALVDAVLLLYLALGYNWFAFDIRFNNESLAAMIVVPLLWAFLIGEKAAFAAYFYAIGSAIVRELRGQRDAPRWQATLATIVLLAALAGSALVWVAAVSKVIDGPPGFLIDRLTLFDGLAHQADDYADLFGISGYVSGSIGRYLLILLAVAYLSEKYVLAWWRVRWSLPLVPVIAVGWLAWSVHDGEQRLRDWLAVQQWRAVSAEQPWLAALDACATIGDGWRLPRREELARYLSTDPAEIREWKEAAWTGSATNGDGRAIAVDLKARKSGRWNKGSELTRDESLCEYRDQPGYASDWLTALRPRVCEATTFSAYLYTPGLKIAALQTGNVGVSQPNGSVICVRPAANAPPIGIRERRGYKDEKEYASAAEFTAYMKETCGLTPDRDRAACFAFAPDLPAFEESGDERTMRAFCEMARNGEGCDRYATMMAAHPDAAERVARYRTLACQRGYATACGAKQ